jgi:hypothetical protein
MRWVRAFFYVSGGIFLLALGFSLGAGTTIAQPGGSLVGGGVSWGGQGPFPMNASGVLDRTFYYSDWEGRSHAVTDPIPSTSPVIASDPLNLVVLLANGDVYQSGGEDWAFQFNLLAGGPVPAKSESWGRLKARFRDADSRIQSRPADPQGR